MTKLRATVRGNEIGLQYEYLAAQLAAFFAVPMPPFCTVSIDLDLAESVDERVVHERLRESVGINFGTEYLRGTSVWIAGRRIPEDRLDEAACIYAFDALIENVDRHTEKPNLLFDGDSLWAIDHELSFAFTRTIGIQPGDWAGNRLGFLEDHPFRSDLARRQAGVSFAPFRDRLRALDDATIDAICNSCPAEFGDAVSTKIVDHLKMARARSSEFTESVLGTLT